MERSLSSKSGKMDMSEIGRDSTLLSTSMVPFSSPAISPSGMPTPLCVETFPFDDAVSILAICWPHRRLALRQVDSQKKGLWFPTLTIQPGDNFPKTTQLLLACLGGSEHFTAPQMIHLMRMQMPTGDHVTRCIFYCQERPDRACACTGTASVVLWCSFAEVTSLPNLWGTEPSVYVTFLSTHGPAGFNSGPILVDTSLADVEALYRADSPFREMLVRCCQVSLENVLQLYGEFSQHCYPAQYLTLTSFLQYRPLACLGVKSESELALVFQAFQYQLGRPYLALDELISGLAAMDKATEHGGRTGRVRVNYLFRFYNRLRDEPMTNLTPTQQAPQKHFQFDVVHFAADLLLAEGTPSPIAEETLNSKIRALYESFGLPLGAPIPYQTFRETVGSLKIRGTSSLFRAAGPPRSVFAHIMEHQGAMYGAMVPSLRSTRQFIDKPYRLASHIVELFADGIIRNTKAWTPRQPNAPSSAVRLSRQHSDDMFWKSNPTRALLEVIRKFAENPQQSGWLRNRKKMFKRILSMCDRAKSVLQEEARMLIIRAPVYVFGDLHGNLRDLMLFERQLWRMGPSSLAANYLFLGDFVDRGLESIETIIYLLCYKLLAPTKFYLLRGNHEERALQKDFTFYQECLEKFGPAQGETLWERVNQVFDVLPLCAVVDSKVFCCHGGIPLSVKKLDEIPRSIPCPLPDPEDPKILPVAHEILWNDPLTAAEFAHQLNTFDRRSGNLPPHGFLPNTRRNTGYFFSEEAVAKFLADNQLGYLIRAHEAVHHGYAFHCDGRCITVFSSSRYTGNNNIAAVILAADSCLRILQIDTYE